ncbi:GntR family transcriptional regulator [Nakamurella leprariae]|uniref:GntR family transcriptional regulator n=1 Tax=Nakamurella leprariae TaxID=2803911 RepID=A0A938YDE1_9ACTN|nr:GntR family transcriptional regulator [Nakamurella leprariae]MBM9465678.1 GntR family transcriptional regulator [Nakamurella leprariae]
MTESPVVDRTSSPGLEGAAPSIGDRTYAELRAALLAGRHRPGSVLLETAIAAELEISRTPAREALVRLTQDGLLQRRGRGFEVRIRTVDEIVDIYDARIVLEGWGAATAAERRTSVDLARLHAAHAAAEVADTAANLKDTHRQFHQVLKRCWHNPTLVDETDRLHAMASMVPHHEELTAKDARLNSVDHQLIVDAIDARDAEAARTAAMNHLRRARDRRIARMAATD